MRTPEEFADAGLTLTRELLQLDRPTLAVVGEALEQLGRTLQALAGLAGRARTPADFVAPQKLAVWTPPASAATPAMPPDVTACVRDAVREAVLQAVPAGRRPGAPPTHARPVVAPPTSSGPKVVFTCEEAEQQRRDPARVAALRANGMVFLEKVHYYLQLLDDALEHKNIPIAESVICALECLPGSPPALPQVERDGAAVIWQQAYAILQKLKTAGTVDADDEVTILLKLGDDPLRPPDSLALGQDLSGGDPFAPAPGEPPAPPPEDV